MQVGSQLSDTLRSNCIRPGQRYRPIDESESENFRPGSNWSGRTREIRIGGLNDSLVADDCDYQGHPSLLPLKIDLLADRPYDATVLRTAPPS